VTAPVVPPAPSLRHNSMARLAADLLGLVFALVAATITARALGPSGKGYYSSLVLLGGLLLQVFSAGLGEAAIVLIGSGKATLQEAASATVAAIIPLALAGGAVLFATASVVFPERTDGYRTLLLAAAMVVVSVLYNTAASFLVAEERLIPVAGVAVMAAAVTTVLIWVFVAPIHLGTAGALLGTIAGSSLAVVTTVWLLARSGLSLRPRLAPGYLRSALRFGAALQFANLLVQLTARLDLVLVYRLASPSDAGNYSIALTIGALVGAVPLALAYAAFPRLALVGEAEARVLTTQVFRMGITAALLAATVLALLSPVVVPLVFGQDYAGAIGPTLLLAPAGVLWSGQWLLCRAAAARGVTRPLLRSFAISFGVMIALDFALIGRFEGVGAGMASMVASGTGLLLAARHYRRSGCDWREFVPRATDARALTAYLRQILAGRRPAETGPPDR
jgi:O-antigen/teichoic acid export membrane protein